MNRNILEHLYYGEIYPAENIGVNSSEMQIVGEMLKDVKEKLLENLSGSELEYFKELDELQSKSAGIYGYECFTCGFKIAILIMVEALSGKDDFTGNCK